MLYNMPNFTKKVKEKHFLLASDRKKEYSDKKKEESWDLII